MFEGFKNATVEAFLGIRLNNSREYMEAHRQEYYRNVRDPFYTLIDSLADTALEIDPEMETRPHKCLSRINRDTRFSRDKSLYRDHLWFCFHKAACPKEECPMLWFEFGPDQLSWGLGTWFENRSMMEVMRARMLANPREFIALLRDMRERGMYLGGNTFKRMAIPPELPPELESLYRHKDIYLSRADIRYEWAFQPDLTERLRRDYLALKPFYLVMKGCMEEAFEAIAEKDGTREEE